MRLTRRQAITVAIVCGLLAALLTFSYLRRVGAPTKAPPTPLQTVVVAQTPIHVGDRIVPTMLAVKKVPANQAPADALLSVDQANGWVAVTPIQAGAEVTRSNAREPSANLGLSFLVPEGMRAVTVALDQVSGLSGLAKPGDHVDVIATFQVPSSDMTMTRTVLQDIEVLAVGTQVAPGSEPTPPKEGQTSSPTKVSPTATLAVTPQDAERLILADSQGKIRLSLRRAGDKAYVQVPSLVNWNLIGYRPPQAKPAPAPAPQQAAPQPAQAPPPWYQPGAAPPAAAAQAGQQKPVGPNGVEVFRGSQREVIVP